MQISPLCLQGFWISIDLSVLPKNSMLAAFLFRLLLVFNTHNSVSCSPHSRYKLLPDCHSWRNVPDPVGFSHRRCCIYPAVFSNSCRWQVIQMLLSMFPVYVYIVALIWKFCPIMAILLMLAPQCSTFT